jgi:hypothetical protein
MWMQKAEIIEEIERKYMKRLKENIGLEVVLKTSSKDKRGRRDTAAKWNSDRPFFLCMVV